MARLLAGYVTYSVVSDSLTPQTGAHQARLFMEVQDAQVRVLLVLDCAFSGCPLSHATRGRGAVRSLLLGHKSHHEGTTLMT